MDITFGSLFAGIGGFDLGFERAGMSCEWQVEIDEFCQKVLTKHWPDVPKFGDIRDVGKHNLRTVDVICGGFPCQPFSVAGKQEGDRDDRHLWPEMLRVISELKPAWVVGENVPGIIPIFLDEAISNLETEGYTCEAVVLPACAFDAPHRRDRIFVMAYSASNGRNQVESPIKRGAGSQETVGETTNRGISARGEGWIPEPSVGRVANGVPNRVDRLRGLGNAVVPQVAEFIGKVIVNADLT